MGRRTQFGLPVFVGFGHEGSRRGEPWMGFSLNGISAHLSAYWLAVCCAAMTGLLPFLMIAPAAAGSVDYCVSCKGPAETYRCRVQGSGATRSDALKLYCVVRTAKEGGHASCSAKKASASCVGLVKVFQYDGPALPPKNTSDPRVREINERIERIQRENRSFDEKDSGQAKSLFEFGGRAYDASKRGLQNAGAAVGLGTAKPKAAPPPPQAQNNTRPPRNFARRSYDCMMSFFRDCSDN